MDRPSDPVRQQVVEVRRALLRLHKALIDSERAAFEARFRGFRLGAPIVRTCTFVSPQPACRQAAKGLLVGP